MARVRTSVPVGTMTGLTHMVIVVKIGGTSWLADVAFGASSALCVIELTPELEQRTPHDWRRIVLVKGGFTHQIKTRDTWSDLYHVVELEAVFSDWEIGSW